jgi:hypothetical protein
MARSYKWAKVIAMITLLAPCLYVPGAHAQGRVASRFFPETGQTVQGRFIDYWEGHGGLMQQGYPISGELQERSEIDGKTYTVQYFERAVFELHPENAPPYDVLLSLLGSLRYRQRYPDGAPGQRPNGDPRSIFFPETGKRIGGSFLAYFNQYGGLTQQGLPLSDEFQERSDLDGKLRTVQYFERAVFEWNPSNTPPYNVLLAQLGTLAYRAHNSGQEPPLQEPALPQPAGPGKNQYFPQASGRYLVWDEGQFSGPVERQNPYEFDIRALDLATNQPVTVSDAPGNQTALALDRSLLVWKSEVFDCQACPSGVFATDLATGKGYDVAPYSPGDTTLEWRPATNIAAAAGRTVGWLEYGDGGKFRIMAKNVDTGSALELRTVLTSTYSETVIPILMKGGGRYLVWNELTIHRGRPEQPGIGETYSYALQVYDITTRKLSTLLPESSGSFDRSYYAFALDGNRLAWSDRPGNISVIDLAENTRANVAFAGKVALLSLHGDRLLVIPEVSTGYTEVHGINLSSQDRKPVLLLSPEPGTPPQLLPRYSPTIAGDWLVWTNASAPQSRLNKKKLDW